MTKKEVKFIKEKATIDQNYKKAKCDFKNPWVSEQDELEFKDNVLANELNSISWNLTDD